MSTIKLNDRILGEGHPCFVIAEVAQSHDGSLGLAHAFIDAAAAAGADAIKFQTHIAQAESTRDEPWRIPFSKQDASRYDYWKRMEFDADQWRGLCDHATEKGLMFLSSAFSVAAVDLLSQLPMPAWKVGSGEFASADLLNAMTATGRPVLLSTGMSSWVEIDAAVARLRGGGAPFALFQCTSRYPSPLEDVGLNVMGEMRRRYGCPVGLSDHSGSPHPSVAAIARGADLLEVHVTFDRAMFGPDVPASLTFDELAKVIAFRDACVVMDAHPVDKDAAAAGLSDTRRIFTKSLAPTRPLHAGTVLAADMLIAKKPSGGIAPDMLEKIVGRRLLRAVTPDRLLLWDDLAPEAADA